MGLIKKIDVDKYFAAKRAMRLRRLGLVSQHGSAEIKSAATRKRVQASAEALTLGHSSPSVSSTLVPMTSDSGRNRLLRPPGSRQE